MTTVTPRNCFSEDRDAVWNVRISMGSMNVSKDDPKMLAIYAGYNGAEYLNLAQAEQMLADLTDIVTWMKENNNG